MNDTPTPPQPPQAPRPMPPRRPGQQESANVVDALLPTNPMAAISCYMGIFSIILCFLGPLLGPGAILLGILGLKKGGINETSYGKTTSTIRAWIGIVTGSLGTLVGILFLVSLATGAFSRM